MKIRGIQSWIFTSILLLILICGCRKYDTYPLIPHIDLLSLQKISDTSGIDQRGIIGLSFTDGDGDLGLTADQNTGKFQYKKSF